MVDEYHNVLGELFRYGNSWVSLKNLAQFGAKIICLSATANPTLIKLLAGFMGIGDGYKIIGIDGAVPGGHLLYLSDSVYWANFPAAGPPRPQAIACMSTHMC